MMSSLLLHAWHGGGAVGWAQLDSARRSQTCVQSDPIQLTWSDGKVNAAASQPSMILSAGGAPAFIAASPSSREPISKSLEEDNETDELNKAQEVLGVVLPADEDSALPLDPGEEALNEPAAHVAG
jgi:hypothetical protein